MNRVLRCALTLAGLMLTGSLAIAQMIPFPNSAPPTAQATFIGCLDGGATGGTQTYAGAAIGAAAADRVLVVVTMATSNNRTISSATIGGNAATIAVQSNDAGDDIFNDVGLGIAYLAVPTGTTATIEFIWSGAVDGTTICVYRLTGLISGTPTVTAVGTSDGSGNNPSSTITVAANSILITGYGATDTGYPGSTSNLGAVVWTGAATEDRDSIQANPTGTAMRVSSAHQASLGAQSNRPIGATSSSPATGGRQSIIAATWH